MSLIQLNNVSKVYGEKENQVIALKDITLDIEVGEMVAIMGPSGSGKSTLLNILGCLDNTSKGKYFLEDQDISQLNNEKLGRLRNRKIGFVFQQFGLFSEYTSLENLEMPLIYRNLSSSNKEKFSRKEIRCKALELLDKLDIKKQEKKYPKQMSGGQQQRVAIGRALIAECPLILADEPTGALDQKNGKMIMNLLKEINESGKTIVIVTHDENIANQCKRKIYIEDGQIIKDTFINQNKGGTSI